MRLDVARLCLDCEEIHEEQVCPRCGSEAFAFLTRWIEPSTEPRLQRPARQRAVELERSPASAEQVEVYRQLLSGEPPRRRGLLAKSLLGLAAFGLAGWVYRAAKAGTGNGQEEGGRRKDGTGDKDDNEEKE